jgi:hypothetical protein
MLSRAGLNVLRANNAARMVRLCRVLRLIRISKLYKYITVYYKDVEGSIPLGVTGRFKSDITRPEDADDTIKRNRKDKESHIGAALSDLTNRR